LRRKTNGLQEAEQATYAAAQVSANQVAAVAPVQEVQPTTNAADAGAMDVDEDAAARGPMDESHGGVKRKAGEDTEPAVKKPRMGMFTILFDASAADTAITSRTCHRPSEEVNFADPPLITQLLTDDTRDRENCTVFVSELPESATEDDLKALFKDVCLFSTVLRNIVDLRRVPFEVRRHSRG
jgi:hypothetical protein